MLFTELLMQRLEVLSLMNWIAPKLIGLLYITLSSGFGVWEIAFAAVVTTCAYHGLRDYRFIGAGWLLHTGWDFAHYLYGNPIVPFAATSSFGCAICDPVIAVWCFMGAPSVFGWLRKTPALATE